ATRHNRDLSKNEKRDFDDAMAGVENIDDYLRRQALQRSRGEYGPDRAAPFRTLAVPSFAPTREDVRKIEDAILTRENVSIEEFRSVLTTTNAGGEVGLLDPRIPEPRRLLAAIGIPFEEAPMKGLSGGKFGLGGATGSVPEGTTKPEYADLTAVTVVPENFARWTDITVAGIDALGGAAGILAAHTRQLALDEDKHVMAAVAAAAVTGAVTGTAGVLRAIAGIQATLGASPDVIVVNEVDYATLANTSPANADDVASEVVRFSGVPLYVSNEAASGSCYVASLRTVGKAVRHGALRTSSTLAPKTNTITLLSEVFTGFGIVLDGGVRKVSV
ncbi:MAG: hypothetical protein QM655_16185, partial [Nocardioidaceae bacterium]